MATEIIARLKRKNCILTVLLDWGVRNLSNYCQRKSMRDGTVQPNQSEPCGDCTVRAISRLPVRLGCTFMLLWVYFCKDMSLANDVGVNI